ncbi:MAG: hypothetical protein PHR35_05865 [Kiritimatiellae bacterium]|nr:hypothetical protein [Kiritimatiellia bacterium]
MTGVKTLINTRFNLTSGTTHKVFRQVEVRSQYNLAPMMPAAFVSDDGQRALGGVGDKTHDGGDRVLDLSVVLVIAADWNKAAEIEDWTKVVEEIINSLHNDVDSITGCGVVAIRYREDTPVSVAMQKGATAAGWAIGFEVEYVTP